MVHRRSLCIFVFALSPFCAAQAGTKTHVTYMVKKVRHAAWHAAKDPQTWVPAGLSLTVAASGTDRAISNWATTHNPLFGSTQNADHASNVLARLTEYADGITGITRYTLAFAKGSPMMAAAGVATSLAAAELTSTSTGLLKESVGRHRPDASDFLSFPSGHTSGASIHSTLAARNVEALPIPRSGKIAAKTGFALLTYGTGWARVEADKHYLSDILAGAALGHFIGEFLHEIVLGDNQDVSFDLGIEPSKKGVSMGVSLKF